MANLSQIAINAALLHDWETAISVNQEILEYRQNDICALNRLAFAYLQTGSIDKAKKLYKRIINIDKYNIIAHKNLEKISSLSKNYKVASAKATKPLITPYLFLEEPGRTKSIALINVAPSSILSRLTIGETVYLTPRRFSIEVRDGSNTYLGALPDDIAFRLIRFLKSGNSYSVHIKNITKNSINVFIRETKRGKRFRYQPTFTISTGENTHNFPHEAKLSHETGMELDDKDDQEESEE